MLAVLIAQLSCSVTHQTIRPNRKAFAIIKSKIELSVQECEEDKKTKKKVCKMVKKDSKIALGSGTFFMYKGHRAFLTAAHVCLGPVYDLWHKLPSKSKVAINVSLESYTGHPIKKVKIRYINLKYDACIIDAVHPKLVNIPSVSTRKPMLNHRAYAISAPMGIFARGMVPVYEGRHTGNSALWSFYTIPSGPGASGAPIYNKRNEIIGMVQRTNFAFNYITLSIKFKDLIDVLNEYIEIKKEGIVHFIE